MIAKDGRVGCCKGKTEGLCYAERRELEVEMDEGEEWVEDSAEFGHLVPLASLSAGRIFWED
jgi:hypothetical protein